MTISHRVLLVLATLSALGARCSASEPGDGGVRCDADGGPGCADTGTPDAGPRADADVDCLIVDDICVPAYEGAGCGEPYQCWQVDPQRRCVDWTRRMTIGCWAPSGAGSAITACFQLSDPSGPSYFFCPSLADFRPRTPITLARCAVSPDGGLSELPNETWPSCE